MVNNREMLVSPGSFQRSNHRFMEATTFPFFRDVAVVILKHSLAWLGPDTSAFMSVFFFLREDFLPGFRQL